MYKVVIFNIFLVERTQGLQYFLDQAWNNINLYLSNVHKFMNDCYEDILASIIYLIDSLLKIYNLAVLIAEMFDYTEIYLLIKYLIYVFLNELMEFINISLHFSSRLWNLSLSIVSFNTLLRIVCFYKKINVKILY